MTGSTDRGHQRRHPGADRRRIPVACEVLCQAQREVSSQVRTHSFIAQPPNLRRLSLGHKSFAVSCPLALLDNAFYLVLVHRLAIYDPRFLPTVGHPHAVALHFAHCDQLAGGLAPPGVRPCWAHMQKGPPSVDEGPFLCEDGWFMRTPGQPPRSRAAGAGRPKPSP